MPLSDEPHRKRGKYTLHKENPTAFKKGMIPANKGKGLPTERDITCTVCNTVFHWKANTILRKNGYVQFTNVSNYPKTCSKECRYKLTSLSQKVDMIERICTTCDKKFDIFPAWMAKEGRNNGTYCSRECRFAKTRMKYSENEKNNARRLVRVLVQRGVIKQEACEVCQDTKTEPHHYKGYARENWLTIKWLCDLHHTQEHERLRRTGESLLL